MQRRAPDGYRSLLVGLLALAVSLATTAQASGRVEVAGPEAVKTDVASTRLGFGTVDPAPGGATNGRRHGLLVKFASSADGAVRAAAAGDDHLGKTTTRVDVIKIDEGESLDAKLAQYRKRADVVYAEPNYVASTTVLIAPDDPSYSSQWHSRKLRPSPAGRSSPARTALAAERPSASSIPVSILSIRTSPRS